LTIFKLKILDVASLRSRKEVLLATWEPGTGRCLTVYILKATSNGRYEEIFEADHASEEQNFCSQSVLGAAHAYVSKKKVIVQMPIDAEGGRPTPFENPATIDLSCSSFSWNGTEYALSASTRVRVPSRAYLNQTALCDSPAGR
jgi:hypothetical protein